MKRLAALAFGVLALTVATAANAENPHKSGNFGAGLVLGYPHMGVSLNYFMSNGTSLQIDPVLILRDNAGDGKDNGSKGFGGRVDLLFWPSTIHSWSSVDLDWYFGPGANVYVTGNGFALGAELPVGIGLAFKKAPIDLNLEAVPLLRLVDSDGVDLRFGIGGALNARYYF